MPRRLATLYHALPEALRREIDIRRRLGVWRRRGVIFAHVPKAAGTSISLALYGRPLGHFRAVDIRRIAPRLWADCLTFAVLREPVSRLRSAYRFAVQGRTDAMAIARPERYTGPDFADFNRFATRWLPQHDLLWLDPVFRPQYSFVCDGAGTVLVDFLFRLESLEADLARHPELFGPSPHLPWVNASGGTPDPVSPEATAVIRDLYAADVALYEKLERQPLPHR